MMAWIYPALMWVLLVLGVAVGLRAWLWDRAGFRGRAALRCRRCWFDLTGATGDLKEGPIVCPECGKRHASRRSMRKTRRHKRWVLVAGVLLVGAYGAGVWPRMSAHNFSNGVLGAVPTPALILAIPFLPDEAGTVVDRHSSPAAAIPIAQRPMVERIAHQIKIRLYQKDDTSRVDHWLFVMMARRDTAQGLTDPTAIRGEMYRYVFDSWERQNRLSVEDERWARSVHDLEIKHAEYGLESEPAYAHVRVRRLLDRGRWRVRIHKTLYDIDRRVEWKTFAGFYALRPVGLPLHGWWDGAACIYDANVKNSGFYLGMPKPTTFERVVTGTIYDGDPYADIWWPVGEIQRSIEFRIASFTRDGSLPTASRDADRWLAQESWIDSLSGTDIVEDPREYIAWLKSRIKVHFEHDEDTLLGAGLPEHLMLYARDNALGSHFDLPSFTFGGSLEVVIQTREGGRFGEPAAEHSTVILVSDDAWWAIRQGRDDQGRRVFEGQGRRVRMRLPRWARHFEYDDRFIFTGIEFASNDELVGGYVEIRFGGQPFARGGFRALADSDAERVLTAPIRIPLDRSDAMSILRAVRSDTYRIGYKHLYTDAELAEIEREHESRTWSQRTKTP